MTDTYAPWITDPDDPADAMISDAQAEAAAKAVFAAHPELVDKSKDGPLNIMLKAAFKEAIIEPGRDPFTQEIIRAFYVAVNHIDESEPAIRDLIEGDLMDVAGINRTRVSDAITAGNNLAKKIAALREQYIKRAFRHLRDNLPRD